jgi:prepilin signal peptidase PulO-like enzyme (type II secretory pathway)
MFEHIAAAVVSGLVGFVLAPLCQFTMRRAPIHVPYRGVDSHCMNCGDVFAGVQKFPLLARLRKQGSCHTCDQPVDRDAPWFDFVLVASLAVTGGIVGFALALPGVLFFITALLAISLVDLRHYLIPTKMVYPSLWICMALMVVPSISHPGHYVSALIGMAGSWLFFFVVYFINPKGLGFGDVRLSALNGFMTGWLAVANAFLGILLGLFSGAIIGLLLMALRIRGRKDPIPYGPFLAFGAVLAILGPTAALT